MPEIITGIFTMLIIMSAAGVMLIRWARNSRKKRHPLPEPSQYEILRDNYIDTGDIAALLQMEKEMEKNK